MDLGDLNHLINDVHELAAAGDDEAAHAAEDALTRRLVDDIAEGRCPDPAAFCRVLRKLHRTTTFKRHCS